MTTKEDEIKQNLKVVCSCKAIKYGTIKQAILNGCKTLEDVKRKTKAGTGCKNLCPDKIQEMIDELS